MATARHWAEALEPRLLHSADISPLLLAADVLPGLEHQALLDSAVHAQSPAASATSAALQIVFVDATLPDAGTLLDDLAAQRAAGRPLEVVLLHDGEDGLAVIGRTLEGRSGVAAIHLIGHGADGQLQLGSTRLDAQTVLLRAGELAAWRGALAHDADLLIYGCDVAAGAAGRALIGDLAALTGADVAASSDLTGAAAAGGDWVLEVQTGHIQTALATSPDTQRVYAHTLQLELETTASASTTGTAATLRWEHEISPETGRLLVVQLVVGTQAGSVAVSYGGQALTLLAKQDSQLVLGTLRTEVWYLLAPAEGRADVVVTSSVATRLVGGSVDFSGVDQATPFGPVARGSGSGGSVSLAVSAASDDLVLDLVGSQGVASGGYGDQQSSTWGRSQGSGISDLWGSASREGGAGTVTMSQTLAHSLGTGRWSAIAVAVKQAGSNTAPVITSHGGAASAALTVAENTTSVMTLTATDTANAVLSYSIAGGADAALFTIDAASGELRFSAAPDAEAPADSGADNVYELTVAVSDGLLSATQALAVTVADVNERAVGVIGDADAGAAQVLESAAIGSLVGITAHAVDGDASNNTVSYSLADDAGGRFSIDAAGGVVRVAAALDRESAARHDIVVRATSSDGSSRLRAFTVVLLDDDEADVGAVSDVDTAVDAVDETAGIGSRVGITAQAADADATLNAVGYTLDDDAGGRFAIDALSGMVRVAGVLDHETAASHNLTVRATSADGSFSTATFSVLVNDIGESGVGTITDSDAGPNTIVENLAPGARTGLTAQASDPDAGDTITYALLDTAGGRFAIDPTSGIVRSAATLNTSAGSRWDIVVRALSSDGSSTQQTFTIGVGDFDEFDVGAPLDIDGSADAVDEDAAIGSGVGIRVRAVDADTSNNAVSYSLSDDAGGRFSIDILSGRVSVAAALDRESAASHTIAVKALSADGSSAVSVFTIAIGDVNEFFVAAISDIDAAGNAVNEQAAPGTPVGITAHAVDADASNHSIVYSLSDSAGGRFAIDAASGVVRVAAGLDFETASQHRIGVRAQSADGSSVTTPFTIVVRPENDNTPVFVSGSAQRITENSSPVTRVQAVDGDLPAGSLVYTLSGGADAALFSIDSISGALWFADAPDHEQPLDADRDNRYEVEVTASDGSRSARQELTITVADLDEAPRLTSHAGAAAAALVVLEGDIEVGLVAAIDPEGRDVRYRIAGGSDGGLFAIDATSGALRWRAAADFEAPGDHGADNIYDVIVAAGDGLNDSLQHLSVGVANRNEAPTAGQRLSDLRASEDTPFTLQLTGAAFADVDHGDTLAWSATLASGQPLPAWLVFDPATRSLSGTPANADVGSLLLRVQATDAAGAAAWQDLVLTVVDSNDAPLAGQPLPAQTAHEGQPFAYTVPGDALLDADHGDRLQFTAQQASGAPLPAWLVFDAEHRAFSGTPPAADGTALVLRITATDTHGAQAFTDLHVVVVRAAPAAAPPQPAILAAVAAEAAPAAARGPATAPLAPEAHAGHLAPNSAEVPTAPMPWPAREAGADVFAPAGPVGDGPAPAATAAAAPVAATPRSSGPGSTADTGLAPAVLPQFATAGSTETALNAWLHGGELQRNHEALQQQQREAAERRRAALASGVALSGGLSIGYVVWLVRGGVLMSSMLSTLPAWKMLDPLPVLAAATTLKPRRGRKEADGEDVERLFDDGPAQRPTPAPAPRPPAPPQARPADRSLEEIEP